jgi:fibronectin-binding autotransporter adhesin
MVEFTRSRSVARRRFLLLSTAMATLAWAALDVRSAQAQSVAAGGDVNPTTPPTPSWTVGGDLAIGDTGVGTLDITAGGVVDNQFAYVGASASGSGTVIVSGRDAGGVASTWNNAGDLIVGDQGVGELTIRDGATVRNTFGSIGSQIGGTGKITVTGEAPGGGASTWISSASIYVGNEGAGTLIVENGGAMTGDQGLIGYESGGDGQATISGKGASGAASTWTSANIYAGYRGHGVLTISDGGVVNTTGAGYIGANTGGDGSVTIASSGADISTWSVSAEIFVGASLGAGGTGVLTIGKGGRGVTDRVVIADLAAGSGTVHLNGDATGRGVLQTGLVVKGAGTAALDLNGGVLRATRNEADFLRGFTALSVGGGGAWFDTAGHDIAVATDFSGASSLDKLGLGSLLLRGDSSGFTGATTVQAGVLRIGEVGDAAAVGGDVAVQAGATLGGAGTIGGDVAVAGGTLAPGGSTAPGSLTITGDLALSNTSVLNYRLGQAGAVGGALNDLLQVGGDLTLDGVLNVTTPAGGAFGPGVYRLIDFTGVLTDHGLALGSLPGGANLVQTSIAHQVNLISTASPGGGGGGGGTPPTPPPPPPAPINFWDGAAGVAGDGVITGGDGVWQVAGPAVWTQASGKTNDAFKSGLFAIFAAAPGSVTVDNGPGAVGVSGMQFAADGYRIGGGAISLTAAEAVIRVGDGTVQGANFKARLDAPLTGAARLDKTDLGTLILTAANSYSGGSRISSGVLQLGDGGTSGSIEGDVSVGGVLAFARADTAAFGGAISGDGVVRQIGAGTTVLTADSTAFAGRTEVRAGTLDVAGRLGGAVEVWTGGRLSGVGQVGSLANQGAVAPGGAEFGTLTAAGDYVGLGGVLDIETVLGGDASQTDRLAILGGSSGLTAVKVTNRGGLGAPTHRGVQIVQVAGASDGRFVLAGGDYVIGGQAAVVAGAYGYVLLQDPADGGWYLRTTRPDAPSADRVLYQPGAPVYEAYADLLLSLTTAPTLRQRVGTRRHDVADADRSGVWGRISGRTSHLEPSGSTTGVAQDADSWSVQFGVDRILSGDESAARLVGGLTAQLGGAQAQLSSASGGGDISTKAYGVGATLTWYGRGGAYLDAQAQAIWFDSELTSDLVGRLADDQDARGYGFSLEAGMSWPIARDLAITPQAQLSYASSDLHAFDDRFAARIEDDGGESLQGRLGLALDHSRSWRAGAHDARTLNLYGLLNVRHEFLDGARVLLSGAPLSARQARTWGGLTAGGDYSWRDGRFALFGEAAAETGLSSFGDSYAVSANAGFRMRF